MKKRDDVYVTQILDRVQLVKKHLKGISQSKFLKSDLHKSAVIRELEVIGEAARMISDETKSKFPSVPWAQIVGMRNRLIHEYFSVDESIVWEVASVQLPLVETQMRNVFLETAPPVHPWRNCPLGYYFVGDFSRKVPISKKNPMGRTAVRAHCRHNPSGKDQLYPDEILQISENAKNLVSGERIGLLSKPNNANDFDIHICVWTQYWNDIFLPNVRLSPNIVKALFFSESSFNLKIKSVRVRAGNYARGPLQITDQTRKILADESGELTNHYLTLSAADVQRPELALAAATRWLFYKRQMATKYLKREATWEEAVAEYKGYLRLKGDFRNSRGMRNFISTLEELKGTQIK